MIAVADVVVAIGEKFFVDDHVDDGRRRSRKKFLLRGQKCIFFLTNTVKKLYL